MPVVLSDKFVLPFEGASNAASALATGGAGGGVLPPKAVDSFVLRLPEATPPEQLPHLLDQVRARRPYPSPFSLTPAPTQPAARAWGMAMGGARGVHGASSGAPG